jgi:hypothetical protein
MIMADVLKIVLLIVGALIVLVSYWLAAVSLAPTLVARARRRYESRALRTTTIGLLVGAPITALGIGLLTRAGVPLARLAGVVILSVVVIAALIGSAGLCDRIGAGLPSADDERHPWRRVLRGGIVLALLLLFPVVGWFIVLPLTLASGLGATLSTVRRRDSSVARTPITPIPGAA